MFSEKTTIRVKETLDKKEHRIITKWIQQIFMPMETAGKFQWSPDERYHILVSSNNTLVSYLKIIERKVYINKLPVIIGGVGCVMTSPKHRRKCFAGMALLRAKYIIFRKMKAQLGMLLCPKSLLPFYSLFGWQQIKCPVEIDQPQGKVLWPETTMILQESREKMMKTGRIYLSGLPW